MLVIKRLMTQHMPGMLTCKEVDSFLYDFHQGHLSYAEKLKFKFHLSMCSECRAYVQAYKQTVSLTKKGLRKAPSDEVISEELMQIILKSRTNTPKNE
jgi:predicted anti-sigma-YlaC factor YlaD